MSKPDSYADHLKVDFRWNEKRGEGWMSFDGVSTFGGEVLWYSDGYPGFAYGGATSQSFASFLADGPAMYSVPPEILEKLTAIVKEIVGVEADET